MRHKMETRSDGGDGDGGKKQIEEERRGEERRGEGRFAVDGATTAKIARFDAAARRFDHRENQVLETAC